MVPRPQQASQPLRKHFGAVSLVSTCSLMADKNPYTLKADIRQGWSHPCSVLSSYMPSRQCCVQESSCPYLVTEMEGSQQQEGPCGGPVYPPVGLFQSFRF